MMNLLCLVLIVFSAGCYGVLLLFDLYRLDPNSFEIGAQACVFLRKAHSIEAPPLVSCHGFRKCLIPHVRVL